MKGKLFSIEEFSTFDGPGVRITVFLKGCPLRCMWCHNPEGQSFSNEILRSPNGCLQCNACLIAGKKKTGVPCMVEESIAVCPRNLVRGSGEDITPEELLSVLEKKLNMLNSTGGGVTFSGGEPLAQHEFLISCLQLLKSKTNRAIQTSGFCDSDIFKSVIPDCDYVLYDLKIMNPKLHKKYTGFTNEKILENYKILAGSGKDFITRMPLIPNVNDTVENITQTAEFLSRHNVNKIELLPYNKAAGAKYKMLDRKYEIDFDASATPNRHMEIFDKYKIEVNVL